MAHTDACKIQATQFIKKLIEAGLSINEACKKTEVESEGIPAETLRRWWYQVQNETDKLFKNEQHNTNNQNHSPIPGNQDFDHGGKRDGSGRPPKYQISEPEGEPEQTHFRARGTGENEWYTPPEHLDMVRSVLGEIQLDPASSPLAQERVKASQFFSKEDGALDRDWFGKVFLNPPYSQPDISLFVSKLVQEVAEENVKEAILLTHNYTDTKWFHEAESKAEMLCFTLGRIRFIGSDGTIASPTQGQVFFYYGKRAHKFSEVFRQIGFVR
jgi:phage N-6-adenine-methyltransferase